MLAHELRNPLSAISSAVQLARATRTEEHLSWSTEVITRQVGHLSHLIDDLLDVSRIRLGKIQLRKTVLDLSEIIPRAVETVRSLIEKKRHGMTVSLEPGPLAVEADPTRMEQILVNLLTNAAKYTDEGGRVALSAAAGGLRDRGPGGRHGGGDQRRDPAAHLRPVHPGGTAAWTARRGGWGSASRWCAPS